ncbi:putative oxidoreductase C terminal-domain-containing protein [Cubamyces menziesii]|nr:putative oxidoreductase C terminal-domain-containing protein [Cubamyces menziesii]
MTDPINVLLIGAGEINFGSVEGPWNHTLRLERILGARLRVIALIDVDGARAKAAIDAKLASPASSAYANCKVYPTVAEAARALLPDVPHLVIVGAPPFARGTDIPGRDLELQLVNAFPRCALFVEKPVSSGPEDACWRVAEVLAKNGSIVGVGYMLRYLKAVQMINEWARKLAWWDKTRSGGPIVEQATHFCDLSRYFGGDVQLNSVVAHSVQHHEAPGQLRAKRFDEEVIPPENRLPRLTSATWKYKDGAVGNLTHVIALHGNTYDTEFEVYADGYKFKLVDPYSTPKLYIRRPGKEQEEVHTFVDDDPFHTELATFVDVVEDAIKTYELTWAIRRASETAAKTYM